jgi:hypothetical protein
METTEECKALRPVNFSVLYPVQDPFGWLRNRSIQADGMKDYVT